MAEFEALGSGGSEAQFQQFLAYLFEQSSIGLARTGVLAGLTVTQDTTASANVKINAGMALAQDAVLNGVTPLVNNTTKTMDVLIGNPTTSSPRNDIVVFDAATLTIRAIIGTPNAVPTDPTVPTTACPLARLRHAGSATTIPTAKIDSLISPTYLNGLLTLQPGPWVNCTVNGNWTATAGYTPQARLLPFSQVEIRGAVTSAASVSTQDAVSLPSSLYYPVANRFLPAHRTSNGVSGASGKGFQPYVLSAGGIIKIDPLYHEGGALVGAQVYPLGGTISLTA